MLKSSLVLCRAMWANASMRRFGGCLAQLADQPVDSRETTPVAGRGDVGADRAATSAQVGHDVQIADRVRNAQRSGKLS